MSESELEVTMPFSTEPKLFQKWSYNDLEVKD